MESVAPRLCPRTSQSGLGGGPPARGGGDADGLRPGRLLRGGQRGHRPGARRRGLRRGRPARQGCCGALASHVGREASRAAGPAADRPLRPGRRRALVVNSAGCGSAIKEYGHLLRDDPAYRDRADAFARHPGRGRVPGGGGPLAPRHRSTCASPTTTPAISVTPRGSGPNPAPCSGRSRGWRSARSPTPSCAAARPASTTCSSRSGGRAGRSKVANVLAPPRPICWSPPTRAA